MRNLFHSIWSEIIFLWDVAGPLPFILVFVLLLFCGFLIYTGCVQGTDSCLHAFSSGDFCSDCGVQLHSFCSECGSKIDGMKFCAECGLAVGGAQ